MASQREHLRGLNRAIAYFKFTGKELAVLTKGGGDITGEQIAELRESNRKAKANKTEG